MPNNVHLIHSARTHINLPGKAGALRLTGRAINGAMQWQIETPYLTTDMLHESLLYLGAVMAEAPVHGTNCKDAGAFLRGLPGFEAVSELEAGLSEGGLVTDDQGFILENGASN